MRINEKILQICLISNKLGGFTLDLHMRQITTIMNISEFLKCSDISTLILSFNYLKSLEEILLEFKNLIVFEAKVNHLKEIKNLEGFRNLERLDLSTNRISKIENLEKLKSLVQLDLSMNYIEKIENLNLPFLKTLILTGNQIKYIENIENLQFLEHFDVSKNKIESLGCLGLPPAYKNLKRFFCTNNLLSLNYLDDLIFTVQNLTNLEELDLTGNELTGNKHYKYRLLYFKNLLVLDRVEIKGILKNHLETMKKTNEYDNLLDTAKMEALDKLKEEQLLKQQLYSNTYEREREVDMLYERYENNMKNDLDEFIEFMTEYQKKRNNGETVELNENVLSRWKNKIILAEKERERIKEKNEAKYEQIQKLYLDSKLNLINPDKNWYNPNMQKPKFWVDTDFRQNQSLHDNVSRESDKSNELNNFQEHNQRLNKKEIYLNKSTDSKIMAKKDETIIKSPENERLPTKFNHDLILQKHLKNQENSKFNSLVEEDDEKEDDRNSFIVIIIFFHVKNQIKYKMIHKKERNAKVPKIETKKQINLKVEADKAFKNNNDIPNNNQNEWDKILLEPDEEEKKREEVQNSLQSDTSLKQKKKMNLKLDLNSPMNKKINGSNKKDKNDARKEDKLKERLDKLTKSILDKDSSIDSHSLSKNGIPKNDVDWKAKRKEFLQKLQSKKDEEEMYKKKITLEEKSSTKLNNEQNVKKSKSKCEIF